MAPTTSIVINSSAGRNITADPTRIFVRGKTGMHSLRWIPAGSTGITGIRFESQDAPISNLEGPDSSGAWTADWQSANSRGEEKVWKYTVELTIDGKEVPPLDPEIENGAPPDDAD